LFINLALLAVRSQQEAGYAGHWTWKPQFEFVGAGHARDQTIRLIKGGQHHIYFERNSMPTPVIALIGWCISCVYR
jgi:hypothetical protein